MAEGEYGGTGLFALGGVHSDTPIMGVLTDTLIAVVDSSEILGVS